jgi:hypothetical protein
MPLLHVVKGDSGVVHRNAKLAVEIALNDWHLHKWLA